MEWHRQDSSVSEQGIRTVRVPKNRIVFFLDLIFVGFQEVLWSVEFCELDGCLVGRMVA